MAAETRELKVVVAGDSTGANKALKNVGTGLDGVDEKQKRTGEGWKRFGAIVAGVGAVAAGVVGRLSIQSLNAARDLGETQAKIGTLFGRSAGELDQWAEKAANAMGQSKQAALDGAATFAVYGKQTGASGKKLIEFSTNLTELASDMASFSNQTPEDAIASIGSALRGEMDPIEKYGILLNDATLRNRAFKLGIISSTKEALTPQQRVLAVQAELYAQLGKKGSNALGDFARNSGGLANQQRILSANFHNLKSSIGQALLPTATRFVTMLNTRMMPTLNELWAKHGDKVTAFLDRTATAAGNLVGKLDNLDGKALDSLKAGFQSLKEVDWVGLMQRGRQALADITPFFENLGQGVGPSLNSTMNVMGVVFKFVGDNADLLGKALPYLVTAFLLVKTAQAGANAASVVAVPLRIAEVAANVKLAASNFQLAASMRAQAAATKLSSVATKANTAATVAGDVATKRSILSTIGHRIASIASSVATGIWTAIQWALNAAFWANPLTWIIAGIIALIAVVVLIATKTTWFQTAWKYAWNGIKVASLAVGRWFRDTLWRKWILGAFNAIKGGVTTLWNNFKALPGKIKTAFLKVTDFITTPYRLAFNLIARLWNSGPGKLQFKAPDWVPGIGGKSFGMPQLPQLFKGGRARKGMPHVVGELGPEVFVPDGSGLVVANSRVPNLAAASLAPGAVAGETTVIHVTVNVAGSVMAERDLADAVADQVRDRIARKGRRNGGRNGVNVSVTTA